MFPELFPQLLPGSINSYGDQHLRYPEHPPALEIAHALNESQGKNFCRAWLEFAQSPPQSLAQFRHISVPALAWNLDQFHGRIRLPRADYVKRRIDRRTAQVSLFVFHRIGLRGPAYKAKKHGLQHILGICCVARDSVRG